MLKRSVFLMTNSNRTIFDIQVINFLLPSTLKHYIHRVGRTARAGKTGRSISLVGENERLLLKEILKTCKVPAKMRIVPQGKLSLKVFSGD